MLRGSIPLFSCLIAGGLVLGSATSSSAQSFDSAGIVRISDVAIPPAPPVPSQQPQAAPAPIAEGAYSTGEVYYENCPDPNCRHCRLGHGLGHGYQRTFSPPVKRPIYRQGVAYYKMFPDAWTGQQAVPVTNYQYPVIYMPTDTTQLGYYYQHVPYWQHRQGMVPPPPVPSQWHTTVSQSLYQGHHPAGKIIGHAPTAIPTPAGPVYSPAGSAVTPTPAAAPEVIGTGSGLEKTSSSPALLPIN